MPNSSIKDEKLYEELRDEGNSKEGGADLQRRCGPRTFECGPIGRRVRIL